MGAKRPVVMAARFTADEAADVDERRGALTRADYIRWLVLQSRKRGERFGA